MENEMDLTNYESSLKDSWELMLLETAKDISLTEPQYQKIENRYTVLLDILKGTSDPLLADAHIFVQGSIGQKTTIKPAPQAEGGLDTIDADAIVLLPHTQGKDPLVVLDTLKKRFQEGSRVSSDIQELNRGVRIIYADEKPKFHIDVTPARCAPNNTSEEGMGLLEVPDRKTFSWKCSSPRSYAAWLDDVAAKRLIIKSENYALDAVFAEAKQDPMPDYFDYVYNTALHAVIKILKRHRDIWTIKNGNEEYRPISVILTTLATHAYSSLVMESQNAPIRYIDAIFEIAKRMPNFIQNDSGEFKVLNPCDSGENFAEKWNRKDGEGEKYRDAFNKWHVQALSDLELGYQSYENVDTFAEEMKDRFGVTKTLVESTIDRLPKNASIPGLPKGTTRNKLAFGILTGAPVNGEASQNDIDPLNDRLG